MLIIQATYVVLVALVVFLMFYSKLGRFFKASALTLSILLGAVTQTHYVKQLGSPIEGYPSYEFLYIHHIATGKFIKVWVWDKELGDRLYIIPYSQEDAEKLEQAKEETEKGTPQGGSFDQETGDDGRAEGLRIDDWQNPDISERKAND